MCPQVAFGLHYGRAESLHCRIPYFTLEWNLRVQIAEPGHLDKQGLLYTVGIPLTIFPLN